MNIPKLILLQKDLDADIEINHPTQKGEDRASDRVAALVVELAEFANEGRWFKFWSDDKSPRVSNPKICGFCNGTTKRLKEKNPNSRKRTVELEEVDCKWCKGGYTLTHNPLLEEYVDGLHFFISIAIQKGWEDVLIVPEQWLVQIEEEGFEGRLTGAFNDIIYFLMKSHRERQDQKSNYQKAWFVFLVIGLVGFRLDENEIMAAYESKNNENHKRQENGY